MKQFIAFGVCVIMCLGSVLSADFVYKVDYFEIDGNAPGYARDEFDDGFVFPWYIEEQTAFEFDGYLHLTDPDGPFGPFELNGVSWESYRSSVRTDGNFRVQSGAGDFSVTSRWASAVAGTNEFYGMEFWSETGDSSFSVNLNMYNFCSTAAGILDIDAGLGIWLLVDTGSDLFLETAAIVESEITGDVLFRLDYSDVNNYFTASYSLDGGQTFQSSFTPISFDLQVDDMEWYLEAEKLVIPEPATLSLLGLGMAAFLRKRK